jgi:rhizoxin synthesis polyketide synthase/nonribosomal peptide synthetase RhiB
LTCIATAAPALAATLNAWCADGHAPGLMVTDLERNPPQLLPSIARHAEACCKRYAANPADPDALATAAELHANGYPLNLTILFAGQPHNRIPLPTYPFNPQTYWVDGAAGPPSADAAEAAHAPASSGSSEPSRAAARGAENRLWLEEIWVPTPISLPREWRRVLGNCRGRRGCVLAPDAEAAASCARSLRLLPDFAHSGIVVDELTHAELGGHSFSAIKPDVLFLLGAGAPDVSDHMPDEFAIVFLLAQALIRDAGRHEIAIFYSHHAADPAAAVALEAVSGFVRSAMLENGAHRWTVVGHDPTTSAEDRHRRLILEWLARDAGASAEARVIRYDGDVRLEARLAEREPPDPRLSLRPHGKYLITGGLGPVGQLLSKELARRYHAHLIIVSRSALDAEAQAKIAEITAAGGSVTYLTADVADAASLRAALAEIDRRVGTLNGVIHMARSVEDGLIVDKTWESFNRVIRAKLQGTANLDELTALQPLDFFVLFSSMAAFGIAGSADYGYSSAYQNAYARLRHQLQQSGRRSGASISQCWGAWVVDRHMPKNRDRVLAALDLEPIDGETGFALFETSLSCQSPVVGLLAAGNHDAVRSAFRLSRTAPPRHDDLRPLELDHFAAFWKAFKSTSGTLDRTRLANRLAAHDLSTLGDETIGRIHELLFVEDLGADGGNGAGRGNDAGDGNGADESEGAYGGRDRPATPAMAARDADAVSRSICEICAALLCVDAVKAGQRFQDCGVDSVIAIQLAVRLEKELGIAVVEPRWLLDYPSPNALAFHLVKEMNGVRSFAESSSSPTSDVA